MTLRDEAFAGLFDRLPTSGREYRDRLDYELGVIEKMGYESYFLVLSDILSLAREASIPIGPGRGSAGGSLVAYAMRITDLDPIVHGLLFERFLNPQRVSMPDIDIDIPQSQRGEFIGLVRERYGADHVAIIGTYGTIGAKEALLDANRVTGGEPAEGARRSALLPPAKFGRAPDLSQYQGPKDDVYDLALKLEGKISKAGQHAAGVIISPDPLDGLVPLWRPPGQETWVCGFGMHEVDDLGFVKMDFLGIRNLDVIADTLKSVGMQWSDLPILPDDCNDPKAYELLASGFSLGIFQLDSPGMRGLLRLLKPTEFNDISSVLALFRPGPMAMGAHVEFAHRKQHGGWKAEWAIHPELEEALRPALGSTYGLVVFQEQVLQVLSVVCDWSYAESALLFDAMRKKNHAKMEATKPDFYRDGGRSFSDDALDALWEVLVPFSDYSFNRAHTAGYGLVSYWTAYLKANHPAAYMSSLLSSVSGNPDQFREYLAEAERMGLKLSVPDVNVSDVTFTPDGDSIRYGLAAVKNVGEGAVRALISQRPYSSLQDFFLRTPKESFNGRVMRSMALSGALDRLSCGQREGVVAELDRLLEAADGERARRERGQRSLVPWRLSTGAHRADGALRREWEEEVLGIALTQPVVTLAATRGLTETELEWLRGTLEAHPGRQPVWLSVHGVPLFVGSVTLTDRLRVALGQSSFFEMEVR